jgi:exosortase/archaeosortase family protein
MFFRGIGGSLCRAAIFLAVFGSLQLSWNAFSDSSFHDVVIEGGVVAPAAFVAQQLTPGLGIQAHGISLRDDSQGSLNIVNGCDGTEMLFLLLAGFAAAPLRARARLLGMLLGIPVVYVLNLIRILTLLYAHESSMALFDLLHGVVTPALVVIALTLYFYAWTHHSIREPPGSTR